MGAPPSTASGRRTRSRWRWPCAETVLPDLVFISGFKILILLSVCSDDKDACWKFRIPVPEGQRHSPEAQFIVPDWEDKVDYGIGLSNRPVRLHTLARLCPPVSDYEMGYRAVICYSH